MNRKLEHHMNSKEERLKELNDILFNNDLGFIYDFLGDRDNGLVLPFFALHMDAVKKIGLEFCVTTETGIKAGILYKHKLIFMSYGLFDRLCKLALLIHSSGVLNASAKEFKFVDLHLVENPFKGFNDEETSSELGGDAHLLLFLFDKLLSFIVAHEVGHYINRHGDRVDFSDDSEGHKKISRESLIQSHTRELVADNYAFRALRHDITELISSHNPILNDLLPEYKSEQGAALLSLLFVACYFKLMDGQSPFSHFESTHPETAVRIHSIFATYLEPYMDTDKQDEMAALLPLAISLLKRIFKHKGDDFVLDWQGKKSTLEIKQWHLEVENEYPKWCL